VALASESTLFFIAFSQSNAPFKGCSSQAFFPFSGGPLFRPFLMCRILPSGRSVMFYVEFFFLDLFVFFLMELPGIVSLNAFFPFSKARKKKIQWPIQVFLTITPLYCLDIPPNGY